MHRTTVALVAFAAALVTPVQGKDPATTLLSAWPMIMAHDAATTYLDPTDPFNYVLYQWTITQPSGKGTSGLLDCGARAFDWRPQIDSKSGAINMHHGPVEVKHPMEDAVAEAVAWAAGKSDPSDLVLFGITDCEGDGCTNKVKALLTKLNVSYIDDCDVLANLTVADALEKSTMANGGHVLATFDCWQGFYNDTLACRGFMDVENGADSSTTGRGAGGAQQLRSRAALRGGEDTTRKKKKFYDCWVSSSTHDLAFSFMWDYLDQVEAKVPLPGGELYTAQMLWQETDDDVATGVPKLSSLLKDEVHSQLNAAVVAQIRGGNYTKFNMYEVNNVCDSGPELFAELKKLQAQ